MKKESIFLWTRTDVLKCWIKISSRGSFNNRKSADQSIGIPTCFSRLKEKENFLATKFDKFFDEPRQSRVTIEKEKSDAIFRWNFVPRKCVISSSRPRKIGQNQISFADCFFNVIVIDALFPDWNRNFPFLFYSTGFSRNSLGICSKLRNLLQIDFLSLRWEFEILLVEFSRGKHKIGVLLAFIWFRTFGKVSDRQFY